MSSVDWAVLPDSGAEEGLPDRLAKAGQQAVSLEQFFELAKTKRYAHARLRRLVLWAWLGLRETDRPERPAYLRVLGCTEAGRALLRRMKQEASLPIVTKPAHIRNLGDSCLRDFETESRCTDLYAFCLPEVSSGGHDWTTSPVML